MWMKTHEEYELSYVVEQLNDRGYYDTTGKTQEELIYILSRMRALEVEESEWF